MRQLWMICAVLTVGMAAVPATAQQAAPDPGTVLAQASAEVPPPPPVPPPLPPMPSSHHRWVSIGSHSSVHHASTHHATAHHATARHDKASRKSTRHSRSRHHEQAMSPAAKTMRWCANMSPHAMMRHSACKAMLHAYTQDAKEDRARSRHGHKARGKRHDERNAAARHRHSRHSRR